MRIYRWLTTMVLLALVVVRAASGADFEEKRFYVTPFAGWTLFDNARQFAGGQQLLNDAYFGGRAGVRLTDLLWLDLAGGHSSTKACADEVSWTHYSANLMLSPASARTVNPFLTLGGGRSSFSHTVGEGVHSGTFEAAGGLRVRLSDAVGLRLEARNIYELSKNELKPGHFDDIVVGAGLTLAFGGSSKDTDGDGVRDGEDKCPNTPLGCKVDEDGCPLDADGDGVCDGIDQCPDTPKGATVDARGCPTDSDVDGVFDGIDQCPNTPTGCTVDAKGCPVDTDGDGVCDGKDQCPGTPAGTPVDALGCPLAAAPPKATTEAKWLEPIYFEFNKQNVRRDDLPIMRRNLDWIRSNADYGVAIHGHTDWIGTDEYNQKLSDRRAKSAYAWLIAHGVDASRLSMDGKGESQPAADNGTDEGRAKNRRGEFETISPDLRQPKK